MKKRIKNYNNECLIWAWKNPKPDLRRMGYDESGTKLVLIKIDVNEDRVLLSDFDKWHEVLNSNKKDIKNDLFQDTFKIRKSYFIQATLSKLHLKDVISIRKFIAR